MYFNCWTQCQKVYFSDKKQNLRLHARLTGPGLIDYHLVKSINVQQNPGRGAKVVHPRAGKTPIHQHRWYNSDGTLGRTIIRLKTKLTLGRGYFDDVTTLE